MEVLGQKNLVKWKGKAVGGIVQKNLKGKIVFEVHYSGKRGFDAWNDAKSVIAENGVKHVVGLQEK